MKLQEIMAKSVGSTLMAVGIAGMTSSCMVGVGNSLSNIDGDGRFPAHTLYSVAANLAGAKIDRYDNCRQYNGPDGGGPWDCNTLATVVYDGDSIPATIAAYMPRGSGLLGSANLAFLGLFIFPVGIAKKEDELSVETYKQ